MRYYRIIISGAPPAFPVVDPATGAQWSSIINGQHDPNAQQVEFQIEEWTPNGSATSENSELTIYGVSFDQIKQSADLVGKPITIYGGMSPGLPLATFQARNAGLLMQAKIIKCWG